MAASKSQKSMSPPLPQPASSMDIISSSGSASASSASAAVGGAAGGSGVIPGASALTYTPQECFYCLTPCASFRRGWKIRNGKFAALCFTCSSAYEQGSFCKIFHWRSEGWRNCATCERPIHCGCIMAQHTFVILDAGGVQCTDCLSEEFAGRKKNIEPAESSSVKPNQKLQNPSEVQSTLKK